MWRLRDPFNKLVCAIVGHDLSWFDGVSMGFARPICRRCKEVK